MASSPEMADVDLKTGDAYAPAKEFDHQTLKVSDLHTIHFWQAGNPKGKPVLFVHGGPGSGTSLSRDSLYFNPEVYRIVLVDQRGAGESEPTGETRENTTWDLVADFEKVREQIGVDKWMVFGGSWGSTLALAYAQTHPDRTAALVLRGVYLSRSLELQFSYQDGAHHIWPEAWDAFCAQIPQEERHDMIAAYSKRLNGPDDVALPAARAWSVWEDSTAKLIPDPAFIARSEDDKFALYVSTLALLTCCAIARIEAHYFANLGFMPDGHLIKKEQIDKIRHIPCIVVQGRYDIVCPVRAAWDLKKAWPELRLYIVPDAGHSAAEPGTKALLVGAADEYASTLQW